MDGIQKSEKEKGEMDGILHTVVGYTHLNSKSGKRSTQESNQGVLSKSTGNPLENQFCFEGEDLARLLKSIHSQIESTRTLNTALPDKFWLKQQFSIGVNEVTRVLERMPPNLGTESYFPDHLLKSSKCDGRKAPSIRLQAVLLASDCNPRWLTKTSTSSGCFKKGATHLHQR
ncbi:Ribosomal protein L7Ae/L30e/S12e/Gadd45 family protein [Abeliophyllum distichum]|uniref:Ribosomal protein L7Ae/L30e/S12e/Gadd45 family protein n=1 Tax=Abeliophyllum distichum TaxID=126358 RepID=A0ABD1RE94_9LAMI